MSPLSERQLPPRERSRGFLSLFALAVLLYLGNASWLAAVLLRLPPEQRARLRVNGAEPPVA